MSLKMQSSSDRSAANAGKPDHTSRNANATNFRNRPLSADGIKYGSGRLRGRYRYTRPLDVPWQTKSAYCYNQVLDHGDRWACGQCNNAYVERPGEVPRWMNRNKQVECGDCHHVLCPEPMHCRVKRNDTPERKRRWVNHKYPRGPAGHFHWMWADVDGKWELVGHVKDTYEGTREIHTEQWRNPFNTCGKWLPEAETLRAKDRMRKWTSKKPPEGVDVKTTTGRFPPGDPVPIFDKSAHSLKSRLKKCARVLGSRLGISKSSGA